MMIVEGALTRLRIGISSRAKRWLEAKICSVTWQFFRRREGMRRLWLNDPGITGCRVLTLQR